MSYGRFQKNLGIALILVLATALVCLTGCSKDSALFKAIGKGDIAKVEQLLEDGADPNYEAINGVTPLMTAISDCRLEIFELLLDYGADVNAEDMNGQSIHDYTMKSKARDCPYPFEKMVLKHEDFGG